MKNGVKPDTEITGVVFDIQRYSLHDGPGLRTNVFLKGCGLSCRWCSNPEGKKSYPEIALFKRECFLCEDCIEVCESAAIRINGDKILWDRSKCDNCRRCTTVCSSRAFRVLGQEMKATEVINEVLRDMAFFQDHGGITLTGGEPSLQAEFAREILRLAKVAGIHTAMETCGAVPQNHLVQLLPYLDLVLFDLKHLDPKMHKRMTGQDNELILDNLDYLLGTGVNLTIRIPIIPGFNSDEGQLTEMAKFICSLDKNVDVHLLGYHTLGKSKYAALGRSYPMGDTPVLKPEKIEKLAKIFQNEGIPVSLDGNSEDNDRR